MAGDQRLLKRQGGLRNLSSDSIDQGVSHRSCRACGQVFAGGVVLCPADGTLLTPLAEDPFIGTTLAERYQVLALLGKGGMGMVYKAKHMLMDRLVAVKVLHAHLVSDATTLQRFQREAKAASHLTHQNIVAVFDFGITPQGMPYLVMDYLEGEPLDELIKSEKFLPAERAIPLFMQACDGLGHAHLNGVVHRDVKPGNIVIVRASDGAETVKIVDFSIAKLLPGAGGESLSLTQTGEVFGSPLYMSPEQCMAQLLDGRSDIYSFGCVMYETLTGTPPLVGAHPVHTIQKHIDEMPAPMASCNPAANIPPGLEAIVLKAMAKDPDKRYQTLIELKRDLQALVLGLPQSATASQPEAAPEPRAAAAPDQTGAGAAAKDESKKAAAATSRKMSFLASALALIAAGAGLAYIVGQQQGTGGGSADHSLLWERYDDMAQAALSKGDLGEANKYAQMAAEQARFFPPPQLRLARSCTMLGEILVRQKNYSDAELAFEKARSLWEQAGIDDTEDVLRTLVGMAKVYELEGNASFAQVKYRQVLAIQEKLMDADDPEIVKTLCRLAMLNLSRNENGKAETRFHQAVAILDKSARAGDAELRSILADYGRLLLEKGQPEKAEKISAFAALIPPSRT